MKNIIIVSVMLIAVVNVFALGNFSWNNRARSIVQGPEGEVVCRVVKVMPSSPTLDNERQEPRLIKVCEPSRVESGMIPGRGIFDPIVHEFRNLPDEVRPR